MWSWYRILTIANFGLRITDYRLQITDYGFWILDFGFWILDFAIRILHPYFFFDWKVVFTLIMLRFFTFSSTFASATFVKVQFSTITFVAGERS